MIGALGFSDQRIDTATGGLGNKRSNGDHPNYRIVEISQNTEKSPGYFRRLTVTQTPVRNRQLTLAWNTRKGVNNNNSRQGDVQEI